jgi:hypothetical protein
MSDLILRGNFSVFLRHKVLGLLIITAFTFSAFAQTDKSNLKKTDKNAPAQAITAEQVAESVVLVYGTRVNLSQVRKTAIENGKISVFNSDSSTDKGSYIRRVVRGDNLYKEKVRLDQKFPSSEFSLIHTADKIFGILNGETFFTPKKETTEAFQNQMFHGLEALLRYKENESKLELGEKTKQLGVEFYQLDVVDKDSRRTKFFVSTKLLRVMSLEYTFNSVKYTRKFHNYNYAQQTLVPFRTTLYAGDKLIEESSVSTITFGQKIDDAFFEAS